MRWEPSRLIFVAFDLLHLDGQEMRFKPTVERKAALEAAIGRSGGEAFYVQADRLGFEGMVSKRASAPYRSGRVESWLKIKSYEESVYEVAGVLREAGRPAVAYMVTPDKERRYVGGAFITLNQKMRERLWSRVQQAKGKPVKGIDAKPGAPCG
jgi:bifunctional non-homologous end joining protein LigD